MQLNLFYLQNVVDIEDPEAELPVFVVIPKSKRLAHSEQVRVFFVSHRILALKTYKTIVTLQLVNSDIFVVFIEILKKFTKVIN